MSNWMALVLAGVAHGSSIDVADTCVQVGPQQTIWSYRHLPVTPNQPWCLTMPTPVAGTGSIDMTHTGGVQPLWDIDVLIHGHVVDHFEMRQVWYSQDFPIPPDAGEVTVVVVGPGHGFDFTLNYVPTPPHIDALVLPDGTTPTQVHRGDKVVLRGTNFADNERTMVHIGGVLVDPDTIHVTSIALQVPIRAHDRTISIEGPTGYSPSFSFPLADALPGPAMSYPPPPPPGDIALELVIDHQQSWDAVRPVVDRDLATCGLSTSWKITGHLDLISLVTLELAVPDAPDPLAAGSAIRACLAKDPTLDPGKITVPRTQE